MRKSFYFILFSVFLISPKLVSAQISVDDIKPDSSKTVEITLQDRTKYIGAILSLQNRELELQTSSERIFIRLERIDSIRQLDESDPTSGWFPNPNRSRLFFSPKATPIAKGSGYYQNVYVFFSNVTYAVSDNVSLSGGLSLLPGLALPDQLYFFSGKWADEVGENHFVGAGAGVAFIPDSDGQLFTGFGNYTYDAGRGSVTTGLNLYASSAEIGSFSFLLGGDYRISERIGLVTENHLFPEAGSTIISYGIRFMGEQMSFDLAFFRPGLAEGIGFGVPYVDFVFNF